MATWLRCLILIVTVVFTTAQAETHTDTFGSGANEFAIDFVTIRGDASSANGTHIGSGKPDGFVDPGHDYRIGVHQITNSQWSKFELELGIQIAQSQPHWGGSQIPVNNISWYEMAQFVNWLNTSTGHQPAYKFTGTQGRRYTWEKWSPEEAMDGTHLYRHKDAYYFLPTDDELVKAGYWNGTEIQKWATKDNTQPVAGVDSNYENFIGQPWEVGSGSEELNGTYDIMGNLWETTESPYQIESADPDEYRVTRGGTYACTELDFGWTLGSSLRGARVPWAGTRFAGFRVASIPEPATVALLGLGGLVALRKRRGTVLSEKWGSKKLKVVDTAWLRVMPRPSRGSCPIKLSPCQGGVPRRGEGV